MLKKNWTAEINGSTYSFEPRTGRTFGTGGRSTYYEVECHREEESVSYRCPPLWARVDHSRFDVEELLRLRLAGDSH